MADLQKAPWPDWETVRLIGRGGFGTVYEIQRKLVDDETESAALKVITIPQNPSDVEELYGEGYDDESITATFNSHLKSIIAEYSLMRKMDGSANVVNCKDIRYIQHDDGIGWDIYIRMELLTPLMKALPIAVTEDTVIRIGKDICNALVLCKKHEIVHRDIKPQNIFVSPNGDYKLGDFGIAKTVEKTMGGTKIGTYKYMAPEVYNNQPYGSAADIYSLGLVLYWLLNERRMPFLPLPPAKMSAGQDDEARQRRLSGEPLPPPANGSEKLKQIVLKACAYDPKDRYASASVMLEDLNKLTSEAIAIPPVVFSTDSDAQHQEDDQTIGLFHKDSKQKTLDDSVADDFTAVISPSVMATCDAESLEDEHTVAVFHKDLSQHVSDISAPSDSNATVAPIVVNAPTLEPEANAVPIEPSHAANKPKKQKKMPILIAALLVSLIIALMFIPVYGEWSDWSQTEPTSGGKRIESVEQYSYRSKELIVLESGVDAPSSAELINQWEDWSVFSDWSDWQAESVEANEACEVECRTQYRSRTVTVEETYSEWSEWGDWGRSALEESDLVEVERRTAYDYNAYRYYCRNCGQSFSRFGLAIKNHAQNEGLPEEQLSIIRNAIVGNCSEAEGMAAANCTYSNAVLTSANSKLTVDTSTSPYQINYGGTIWYTSSAEPSSTYTQYRSRTRSLNKENVYSDWTEFSDTEVTADDNTEVESRVQYRYRTRERTTIYQYTVWSEWSEWQMAAIEQEANTEVKQETFYRYAERYFLWQKLFGLIP